VATLGIGGIEPVFADDAYAEGGPTSPTSVTVSTTVGQVRARPAS
jgi:hypothetical protein